MDLKKLTGKLTTIVAAGAMVMSIGGGVVWLVRLMMVSASEETR